MDLVVGIDPGLRCTGVAVYDGAWHIRSIRAQTHSLPDRLREIASQITGAYDLTVIELPQVYPGRRQVGDPNDLISLAVLVGALAVTQQGEVLLLRPGEWKGNVPKDIHHARIRQLLPDLGRCSRDALDAVGLCLYGIEILRTRAAITLGRSRAT